MFYLTESQVENTKRIIEYYNRTNDNQLIINDVMIRSKVRLKKMLELIELYENEMSDELKEFVTIAIKEEIHNRNNCKCSLVSNMSKLIENDKSKL